MSRIRANKITDKAGTGAIEIEKGAWFPVGYGLTGAGSVNITGVVTATSFSGSGAALTGIDATAIKDSSGNVKVQAQASGAMYTGIHTFSSGAEVGSNIKLGNAGVITATSFSGDGSNLTSLPAGLGTALSSVQSSPLNKIYYTNSVLGIDNNTTIDVPASASAAYTQYTDINIANGIDLIISDGDDLVPDVLGLRPDGTYGGGSIGRIRVDKLVGKDANSAINVEKGLIIAGVTTTTGELQVGGKITQTSVTAQNTHKYGSPGAFLYGQFNSSGDASLNNQANANLLFATNNTERLRINNTGIITATNSITATAFIPTTGQLSHRNIIVNGDMNISQRGTSSTSTGYQTVDRYKPQWANTGNTVTQAQVDVASGTTPYTLGFRKALKISMSGAGTVNSNSYIETYQKIEAQNVATSGWNYLSSSSNITISFWVKVSTNQTFYVRLYAADTTDKTYCFSYTASGNNTWTKITKTIPGNANLLFNTDNGEGLRVQHYMFYGTDYTGSRNLDVWEAAGSPHTPNQATTWYTAGASTWEMTGLQVEVGPVATPFEHRSYGEELRRCERYFQCMKGYNLISTGDNEATYGIAFAYTSSRTLWSFQFKTEMRSNPVIAMNTIANLQGLGVVGGWNSATQLSYSNKSSTLGCRVDCNWSGTPFTAGHAVEMRITESGLLSFSAEL